MWSLGVIVYILLGGYPPFIEKNQRELFRRIRRGDYEFHAEYWSQVSEDAKSLIKALLTVDPASRITATGALQHKWVVGDDAVLQNYDLGVNLTKFKNFNAKRKFKAAVGAVMMANKFSSLGEDFKANLEG
jgi:calcium/calmodulin-dependent protein kinase I